MPGRLSLFGRLARWAARVDQKMSAAPRASYAAASTGRLTESWVSSILSADAEMRGALPLLRARSRQVIRDTGHGAGFVDAIVDGVLGPDGIGCRPRVRTADKSALDDAANAELWERYVEWGKREVCSADGQNSLVEMQRLIVRTWASDGEVFVRRGFGAKNPFGYDVQILDADLCDETYNVAPGNGGNEIRMGVEIDPRGRPLAYHLFRRHPGDYQGNRRDRVRVPAAEIVHLFLQLRPGQTRGVPPLTPVLLTMNFLDEYTIAELMAARIGASAGGGYFETDKDAYAASDLSNAPDGTAPDRTIVMDLDPAATRQLPPGIHFVSNNPAYPSNAFEPFQKVLLRAVARGSGAGLSYATLTGDLSEANYSSDRAGRLSERDAWRVLQHWFADRVMRPVYTDFVRFGLLSGAIRLGSMDATRWMAHDFEYRGWPWVDPLKDINATAEELRLCLTSRQRVCAERGRDFETILEERAEEKRLAEKYDIELGDISEQDLTQLADPTAPAPAKKPAKPTKALRLEGAMS